MKEIQYMFGIRLFTSLRVCIWSHFCEFIRLFWVFFCSERDSEEIFRLRRIGASQVSRKLLLLDPGQKNAVILRLNPSWGFQNARIGVKLDQISGNHRSRHNCEICRAKKQEATIEVTILSSKNENHRIV